MSGREEQEDASKKGEEGEERRKTGRRGEEREGAEEEERIRGKGRTGR